MEEPASNSQVLNTQTTKPPVLYMVNMLVGQAISWLQGPEIRKNRIFSLILAPFWREVRKKRP